MRIKELSAVFMAFLIVLGTVAFADALSLTFNPGDVQPSDTTALIRWQSDEYSDSQVVYGDNSSNLALSAGNSTDALNHSILLQNLNVSTTYFYKIVSSNENGTVELNNSGAFYSFTTVPDLTAPFINLTIPQFYNSARLTIQGTTEPLALVHAYANPQPSEIGLIFYDRETFADANGNFAIVDLPLDANLDPNTVVVWVRDRAGNTNTTLGAVSIDTIPPNVTISIPSSTNTGSLTISGTTDENITLLIYAAEYNTTLPEITDSHLVKNETVIIHSITPFSTSIALQGYRNLVRVVALDRAGNAVIAEQTVLFDSIPPTFDYPTDLSIFDPSYTLDFEIEGKISEKGNVSAFVNGRRSEVVATDENGNFKITVPLRKEVVDEQNLSHATIATASFINGSIIDEWRNYVTLEARDESGLTTNLSGMVRYTLCGVGTWWNVERPMPTPDILSPALLLDGNAQLAFNYRLTWQGAGEEGKITSVSLEKAPVNKEYLKYYDIDWATSPVTTTSQDKKTGYAVLHLAAPDPVPPGMNWTYNEKLKNISFHRATKKVSGSPLTPGYSCKVPGFGCVKVPLMLRIEFTSPEYNGTQKQCWETETAIDASLFIADFIPNEFLNATVQILGGVIDAINFTLEPIREVAKITTYVCLGSIAVYYWFYVQELFTCKFFSKLGGGGFDINNAKQQNPADTSNAGTCKGDEQCMKCSSAIDRRMAFEEKQAWVCDRIFMPSAPTLQEYARKSTKESYCYGSIGSPQFFIDTFNAAKGNYQKPSANIFSGTSSDDSCPRLHPYAKDGAQADPKCCGVEYKRKWNSACVFMDELKESACLQKQYLAGQTSTTYPERLQNAGQPLSSADDLNCHPLWNSAAGFCEKDGGASPDLVSTRWEFRDNVISSTASATRTDSDGNPVPQTCDDIYSCPGCPEINGKPWAEIPIVNNNQNVCRFKEITQQASGSTAGGSVPSSNLPTEVSTWNNAICKQDCEAYFAARPGLTGQACTGADNCRVEQRTTASGIKESPLFFRIIPQLEGSTLRASSFVIHSGFVGDTARLQNTITGLNNPGQNLAQYMQGANSQIQRDTEFIVWPKSNPPEDWSQYIGTTDCTQCFSGNTITSTSTECTKFKKFFDKVDALSKPINTDKAEVCRIYNEIRTKMGQVNQEYIVDPANAGLLRSFQCVALPSMISHLSFWKNVLSVIRNCFVNIMTTGEGSPTVCREVLSVYICDMIYNAIKCFSNKYSVSYNRPEGIGGIGNVLGALTGAGSQVAGSLNQRYGGNAMFQSIFNERRLVHAICLFAFTGDWVFDVEAMFDGDFPVPINSTVLVLPRERRFISANPLSTPSGLTTQNYKIGVAMIAGSDLTFNVKMICSDDYSCSPVNGFAGGRCDCVGKGRKETGFPLRTVPNSLRAGEGLGPGGRGVVEYNQFESDVRYDKVEVSWKYKDSHGKEITSTTGPLEITEVGGRPPAECEFDDSVLSFRCILNIGNDWFALLREVIPAKETFDVGNLLQLNHLISQRLPQDAETKCAANPNCEYTSFLQVRVVNQLGQQVWPTVSSTAIDYYSIPAISDTQTITWPDAVPLRAEMFGLPTTWNIYEGFNQGTLSVDVDNSKVTENNYLVLDIAKNNGIYKYRTCPLTVAKDDEVTEKKISDTINGCSSAYSNLPNPVNGVYSIEYNKATIKFSGMQEDKIIRVIKVGRRGAESAQCTDVPQTWRVYSRILAPQKDDATGQVSPSGQPMTYQGQPQEKVTEIKARCKTPTTTGAAQELRVVTMATDKISYSVGEPITVRVIFTKLDVAENILKKFGELVVKKDGITPVTGITFTNIISTNAAAYEYSGIVSGTLPLGNYRICAGDNCPASFSIVTSTAGNQGQPPLNGNQQLPPSTNIPNGLSSSFESLFTKEVVEGTSITIKNKDNLYTLTCNNPPADCNTGTGYLSFVSRVDGDQYLRYKSVSSLQPDAINYGNYDIRISDCTIYSVNGVGQRTQVSLAQSSDLARLAYAVLLSRRCG